MKRALALVVLAGCATGDRSWERPWLREPASYESAPSQDSRYPIDLPTVLRLAGANNLDVAFVRERVHEAYANLAIAQEKFAPTVGPALAFRRHEGETQATTGEFVDVNKQQTFAGGMLSWSLGDAIYASLAASQRYDAARAGLEAAERAVTLDAALAYYDLVRETMKARVAEDASRIAEKLATEFGAAVTAGRGFKGDVLRARVRQSSSRLARERAIEGAKLASIRLGSLLRLSPGVELYPAEESPAKLALVPADVRSIEWMDRAMRERPEVRRAEAEAGAASDEETGAVYGPLVPDVQANATGGALGPTLGKSDDTVDYAVTLGWKIGPGGLFDVGRQELAASRRSMAEIELARVRQRVADEVRSSLAQLSSREEQVKIAEQAMKDAEEALKLNQERQAAGTGLPLEVLEAEESLARARQDYFVAVTEFNQAQLRLLISSGGPLPR